MNRQLMNVVQSPTNYHGDVNGQFMGPSYGDLQSPAHVHQSSVYSPNMQQNNRFSPGIGPTNALAQRMVHQNGRFSPVICPNNRYPQSPRNNGPNNGYAQLLSPRPTSNGYPESPQHRQHQTSQNGTIKIPQSQLVRGDYPTKNSFQHNSHRFE